jgi:hypothetical protein
MVLQMLLCRINFGLPLMVGARSIILVIFSPVASSSTMVIHTLSSTMTSTRLFDYFSMPLVLELLPMMINYFDSYTHACCLGIAVQIKIMGELCGLFFSSL